MTIKEVLGSAQSKLKKASVSEPRSSAELLLRHVLGMTRAQIITNLSEKLSIADNAKFNKYIRRRLNHEPVWQITGKVQFYELDFYVNRNVLIPRSETEFLVEAVLREIEKKKRREYKILDVGTGAGTIAVTLAHECRDRNIKFQISATDISSKALSVAKKNARTHRVLDQIKFIQADLFQPITHTSSLEPNTYDIITANLPYIPHEDLSSLALEIHHYEPRVALDGGADGLVIYEEFLKQLPVHINPSSMVFCEIGKDQGTGFIKLASQHLKKPQVKIVKDLAGIDRIAFISF